MAAKKSRMTAERLIIEASIFGDGPAVTACETEMLTGHLFYILNELLEGFNYDTHRKSGLAVAARGLAAITYRLMKSSSEQTIDTDWKQSLDAEKQIAAIYEAGRAVAYTQLRLNIDKPIGSRKEAEPKVLFYCSGYAALVAAGYPDEDARTGAWNDFRKAKYLIKYWGLAGGLEEWLKKSVEIMRKPENLKTVKHIACETPIAIH